MAHKKLVIIGHRGAKGLAPENTTMGLKKALEHGVDEIEFDVRVTKDDVAVLAHDGTIHNAAGQSFEISFHSYDDLRSQSPELCTLAQALDKIDARCPVVIEVKPGVATKPIVKVLNHAIESGKYGAQHIRLASFDYRLLKQLHTQLPGLTLVVNESWSGVRATWRARRLGTKRITMRSWWLWSGFIASMSRGGWQLCTYTLNDAPKAQKWTRHGLWGVVTDYPDLFDKE